jgi:hypothetical protein
LGISQSFLKKKALASKWVALLLAVGMIFSADQQLVKGIIMIVEARQLFSG